MNGWLGCSNGVALHEHFGNTCRDTKVSINLEWWMGIKEVGESTSIGVFAFPALVG